jgi:hypothetical protein
MGYLKNVRSGNKFVVEAAPSSAERAVVQSSIQSGLDSRLKGVLAQCFRLVMLKFERVSADLPTYAAP